jgi:hypothetical protein
MNKDKLKQILKDHSLWINSHCEKGKRANLFGADLSKVNLSGIFFSRANLERANLIEADFIGADLRGADLEEANLQGADLRGANLRGADFEGANLSGANLERADLRRADLSEANLKRANLQGADLRGANLNEAYLLGANFNLIKGYNTISFTQQQHLAIFIYSDNFSQLQIGCYIKQLSEWFDEYKEIGIKNNYTEDEIMAYYNFMKYCESLLNINKGEINEQ